MTMSSDAIVAAFGIPYNATTGAQYQGKNVDRLLIAAIDNGYDETKGWAGYAQWLTVGRVVRKGEHGTPCLTIVKVGKPDAKGRQDSAPRGFRVFHFDQTTELGETQDAPVTPLMVGDGTGSYYNEA